MILIPIVISQIQDSTTANTDIENLNLENININGAFNTFSIKANGKKCEVATTKSWSTPKGTFKQTSNGTSIPCTNGFFCPENTFQPFYCCEGFYCPTPGEIIPCSSGNYCARGSIKEESCWNLAYCPAGTTKPFRFGMIIAILGALILLAAAFSIKKKLDIQQAVRNRLQIEMVKDYKSKQGTEPLKRNKKCLDIEFENLEYKLADGNIIMEGVSGFFSAGKMTAIMGPSGAGKTTLFNLLNGKIKKSKGNILLNGKKEDLSKYRKLVGFVPQDDVMIRQLTVNNILSHSANTRLPSTLSSVEKRRKVVQTIEFLGLGHVINTVIGDEQFRGISGGQRKRVNIGMEIVADPSVLFLDEPTSGLDSSTSLELCQILKRLATESKTTVAAIIHSPSPQTFYEFDDIVLLGKGGKMVYFGPTKGVLHYFKELGFVPNRNVNPADFAIDVISGNIPCSWDSDFRTADLYDYWNCYQQGTPLKKIKNDEKAKRMRTIRRKKLQQQSVMTKIVKAFFSVLVDLLEFTVDIVSEMTSSLINFIRFFTMMNDPIRNTPNIFYQYIYLLKRSLQQQLRSSKQFISDSIIHFIAGLIVSVSIQDNKYLGRLPEQVCSLAPFMTRYLCNIPRDDLPLGIMLIVLGVLFAGQATATYTFGDERSVFFRDTSSGMPTSAYFLAKFTADLPRILIASLFYTLSLTVFLDYRSQFFVLMIINLFVYLNAFAFGYLLSVLFDKKVVGIMCAGNALLWAFLFGGVSPTLELVQSSFGGLQVLWSLSTARWGIEAFYIKEVSARSWVELSGPYAHNYDKNNLVLCFVRMLFISVLWMFFAFVALKLRHRRKQK